MFALFCRFQAEGPGNGGDVPSGRQLLGLPPIQSHISRRCVLVVVLVENSLMSKNQNGTCYNYKS